MKSRQERRQTKSISTVFVETKRAREAFARIDELIDEGWEDDNCRALLLLGHSRAGKTHIVNNYMRIRAAGQPASTDRLRILKLEVQSGCTLKIFATDMLIALGDPDPGGGAQAEMTRRIAEAIKKAEYDLLIIDEVQRLIDADTDKVKRDVANWITGLLNRRLCPLLLVGEPKAERVFEGNNHLRGRTFGSVLLAPYDWADEADRQEFCAVIHLLEGKLGLPTKSDLGKVPTAIRIYAYAGGLLGEAATLITHAAVVARRGKRPCLTHDIMAQAVDELEIGKGKGVPNPFRGEVANPRPVAAEIEAYVPRRVRGRTAIEAGEE